MKRELFYLSLAAAGFTHPSAVSAGEKPKQKPNVIIIFADDLGWAELGCYGNTFNETPALDSLARYGVRFTDDPDRLRASLDACRIAYLHAPLFNPAMKAVAPIRRNLAVRTFFNLLGPLVNPALPKYQLLGVYNLSLFRLYNYAYQSGGTRFGVV